MEKWQQRRRDQPGPSVANMCLDTLSPTGALAIGVLPCFLDASGGLRYAVA
jgi:hypothetical protein